MAAPANMGMGSGGATINRNVFSVWCEATSIDQTCMNTKMEQRAFSTLMQPSPRVLHNAISITAGVTHSMSSGGTKDGECLHTSILKSLRHPGLFLYGHT